jgi:hypothetical protein
MYEPLLSIRDHHAISCSDPLIVASDAAHCDISYFENRYGEQWIFTFDHDISKATLRGGDVCWNSEYEVVDGKVAELVLGNDEQFWLRACWMAAHP